MEAVTGCESACILACDTCGYLPKSLGRLFMMSQLVMTDLTVGETLALLAAMFLTGDLSSDEYMRQVRSVRPGSDPKDQIIEQMIEQDTDWDFLNRMLGKPDRISTRYH